MPDGGVYDILVVGGGINGAAIARDASGRGLSVLLCEKNDIASATSSASTKLIHGGLRYLEYYEFRLVREALIEREVLLRAAPHIIWPLRFVLPHDKSLRPAWLIRLGLFLYDHLGGRKMLPGSKGIDLRRHVAGEPLRSDLRKGFVYSDCWVQDSRFVVLNLMDAAARGTEVLTRTACIRARRTEGQWEAVLRDEATGVESTARARAMVNAAGPWVAQFLGEAVGSNAPHSIRLVKGSHIVVPKVFDHDYPYIFQHGDGRIIFAIPYEQDFTLIGTTDVDYEGDPGEVAISESETAYLCEITNGYFKAQIAPADVVWSYSGVRPLYDDQAASASAATRDYILDFDNGSGAPLLNVYGGKITTCRKLAEHALQKLAEPLNCDAPVWTADAALPGGDLPDADFDGFLEGLTNQHPWLPRQLAWRLARNYGTRTAKILGNAVNLEGLGQHFGNDLYEAEVDYLVREEWAQTAEDILWRRSKLGLHVDGQTVESLDRWLGGRSEDRERKVNHS